MLGVKVKGLRSRALEEGYFHLLHPGIFEPSWCCVHRSTRNRGNHSFNTHHRTKLPLETSIKVIDSISSWVCINKNRKQFPGGDIENWLGAQAWVGPSPRSLEARCHSPPAHLAPSHIEEASSAFRLGLRTEVKGLHCLAIFRILGRLRPIHEPPPFAHMTYDCSNLHPRPLVPVNPWQLRLGWVLR